MSLKTAEALAQAWYKTRLSPDWRRPSADEIRDLLEQLGLKGEFWQL